MKLTVESSNNVMKRAYSEKLYEPSTTAPTRATSKVFIFKHLNFEQSTCDQ